jgi:hypothetical protein
LKKLINRIKEIWAENAPFIIVVSVMVVVMSIVLAYGLSDADNRIATHWTENDIKALVREVMVEEGIK